MFLSHYYAVVMYCNNVFICLSCKLYSVSYDAKHHCYDGVAKQHFRSIFQHVYIFSLYFNNGIILNADIESVSK